MITPTSAVMIVFGAVALIGGYSMFRSMLPLWGFILGGWLAFSFLPVVVRSPQAATPLFQAIAFIGGGLFGALISMPLYFVIVFLSGAVLGGIAGVMAGAVVDVGGLSSARNLMNITYMSFPPIPHSNTQIILMVIFGLIMGGVAINFQKFMVIASSSFMGSALMVSGMIAPITTLSLSDMNSAAMMMMSWLVLAVIGMIVQFNMLGEV